MSIRTHPLISAAVLAAAVFVTVAAAPDAARSDPSCVGDCSGGNVVTVDEILTATAIAVGDRPLAACPAADGSGDARVTVDEILVAIDHALGGCPNPSRAVTVTNRHSGKCLEVAAASRLDGANVQQGACTGASHQRWLFVADAADHFIVNENSGQCLEVAGGSQVDLANIRQGVCANVARQRWQITRPNGFYLFASLASARCIDIERSSVSDGANAIQYECRATNNQLWSLPAEALLPRP
jgi:hypothetical protein